MTRYKENDIEFLMQDILTLTGRKSEKINYLEKTKQNSWAKIIIDFDELVICPNKEILIDALWKLRQLDHKLLPFKDADGTFGKELYNFIDLIAFSEQKMGFKISFFFLSKLKKMNFSLEQYRNRYK